MPAHHHGYAGKECAVCAAMCAISRLLFVLCLSLSCIRNAAAGLELSNVPMEVRRNTVPANIMLVLDDSVSMFKDYVFANDTPLSDWRFYWHGENKLYYNPEERYAPWPRLPVVPLQSISSPDIVDYPKYPGQEWPVSGVLQSELSYQALSMGSSGSELTDNNNMDVLDPNPNAKYKFPDAAAPNGSTEKIFPRSRYYISYDGKVYLVILRYNGGSGATREYYQFSDADNNRKINVGELTRLTSLPAGAKPKWTNETTGEQYEPAAQEELENFLQWFVYYRSRMRTAINAMAVAIEQLDGVNVGIYTSNGGTNCNQRGSQCVRVAPIPVDGDDDHNGFPDLLDYLYQFRQVDGNSGTDFLEAYLDVARYFDTADTGGFSPTSGSHPFLTVEEGGTCQQSYAIVVTDGETTNSSVTAPDKCGGGEQLINQIARCYYEKDLAPELPDSLPASNTDTSTQQHLVTYGVAFGVGGKISLDKVNTNAPGTGCKYTDPDGPACFLLHPPSDTFWTGGNTIDALWRATVEGHGRYSSAFSPGELAQAMRAIAADLNAHKVSAVAAAVSGDQISDDTRVILGRFDPQSWTGDLYADQIDYSSDPVTGKVTIGLAPHEVWSAAAQLRNTNPANRLIFTSNGDGQEIEFRTGALNNAIADSTAGDYHLAEAQKAMMLGHTSATDTDFNNFVSWMRGDTSIANLRARKDAAGSNNVLGDIVHSSPVLVKFNNNDGSDDTIFVGANDGMLHAFNANSGQERFAYIPSLVHDHLSSLPRLDYSHRYYVDGSLVVAPIVFFDNSGQRTVKYLLVSGLGRGGRGYFALDVSKINSLTSFSDVKNQSILQWEYPRRSMGADGDGRAENDKSVPQPADGSSLTYDYRAAPADNFDNDGDGVVDNPGEKALYAKSSSSDQWFFAYGDDELGYSYSTPSVNATNNGADTNNHGPIRKDSWMVIFGNGYGSRNGRAVLYILNANTGELIKKINTGVGLPADHLHGGIDDDGDGEIDEADESENGLSSPAALDVDNDGRIDYVYAGDLQGNLWKFDLTSSDPAKWGVAYKDGSGAPKPLFSAPGKSITTRPDIIRHNTRSGYMVLFGTGSFLGESDRVTTDTQTLFGIWDIGADNGGDGYLGVWQGSNSSSSLRLNGALLGQTLASEYCCNPSDTGASTCSSTAGTCAASQSRIRITSDNRPYADSADPKRNWWVLGQGGIYGWYFDLPGYLSDSNASAERVIRDVVVRDGNVIATTFIPDTAQCSAGGTSFLYELDARTGARLKTSALDINGDGRVNAFDTITININGAWVSVAASGIGVGRGVAHFGADSVIRGPDSQHGEDTNEYKIITSSGSDVQLLSEKAERRGAIFWQEITK